VRARILAATNRNLEAEVLAGRFREDLFQRLRVLTLSLPPLRERREDFPLLVEHLLLKINQRLHKNLRRVPRVLVEGLARRPWPGNVRELENLLTRAAVLSQGDVLLEEHLLDGPSRSTVLDGLAAAGSAPPNNERLGAGLLVTLEDVERAHIARVYGHAGGHKGKTCQILGISRPTLERKLRKYGLSK
jgi:two-component system response regulator AtoC